MVLVNAGPIPQMCLSDDNDCIYRGSLILGLSASVFTEEVTCPVPGEQLISPKFELLGCRIYGKDESTRVVQLKKTKKRNI